MTTDTGGDEHLGDGQDDILMLTVKEAARRLGLGRTLVYQLISSGELESVTVGRLRRVPAECLAEYVKALRKARSSRAADGNSAA
ncbi:MAG: helix-turn-helix domain-containing protein [Streptosporangiaceae bacterium]|jgi:excisionase family DNA binding protein|nr:helix-turn-helix domain-containing protein [Streptosporangiaceae bacterium]